MTIDDTPLDPQTPSARAPRLSRRSVLAGLGFGAAAVTVLRTGGAVGAVAGQLNQAGTALVPAHRVNPPTTTTATTTTTTTTTKPPTTVPPVDGAIRFPIVVGADDTCYVGDNFGACRSNCTRSHEGVDIMADQGLAVIAVADGTLTKKYVDSGKSYGAGNGWTLTDDVNDVVYKFFHLDSHADGLEVDDTVVAGQVIGYVGESGTSGANSSQENFHLHFEYRPGNVAQDPYDRLVRAEHVNFSS